MLYVLSCLFTLGSLEECVLTASFYLFLNALEAICVLTIHFEFNCKFFEETIVSCT